MNTPSILALDLSLTCTGVCLNGETSRISYPKQRGGPRIDSIAADVSDLCDGVDLAVIEGYSFGSKGRSVFDIAELGGVIRRVLRLKRVPYVDIPPSVLKKYATGKGNSPKDAMIAAAIRRFGFEGSDNNEADARLLWCMARHAYGVPVVDVPKVHIEALRKVVWLPLREAVPA